MRLLLVYVFLLIACVSAVAQQDQPFPPGWNGGSAPPRTPWLNGDYFPHAGPADHHYGWPGFCIQSNALVGTGVSTAADGGVNRNCGNTPVPPFSVSGGFSMAFPGEPGYDPNEIAQRRGYLRNLVFGQSNGQLPPVTWQQYKLNDADKSLAHLLTTNFPEWGNRNPQGDRCQDNGRWGHDANNGAARLINHGYCNPQTGLADPPETDNMADGVDQLAITIASPQNTFPGISGFTNGTHNQSWYVYYPKGPTSQNPNAAPFNGRVIIVMFGTAGWCSWPTFGNGGGHRSLAARMLNEGFAVAPGFSEYCSGWNTIAVQCATLYIAFANFYDAHGHPFRDYNLTGHSRGGHARYCASIYDNRFKVVVGQNGSQAAQNQFDYVDGTVANAPTVNGFNVDSLTGGFFDEHLMIADGEPGAKLNTYYIHRSDTYWGWGTPYDVRNIFARNPDAWNGKQRCNFENPCTGLGYGQGVRWAMKHTCNPAVLPPCNPADPNGELTDGVKHYLVPPENSEGYMEIQPEPQGPTYDVSQDAGHRNGPFIRRMTMADMWQVGPRGPGRRHGG